MKLAAIAFLIVLAVGGWLYYDGVTQPGPAEQAGAVLDEAIDKTRRVIDVVTE